MGSGGPKGDFIALFEDGCLVFADLDTIDLQRRKGIKKSGMMSGTRRGERRRVKAYKSAVGRIVRDDHGRLFVFAAVPDDAAMFVACEKTRRFNAG